MDWETIMTLRRSRNEVGEVGVEEMTFVHISWASSTWGWADATSHVCTLTVGKKIHKPEKASMNKTFKGQ